MKYVRLILSLILTITYCHSNAQESDSMFLSLAAKSLKQGNLEDTRDYSEKALEINPNNGTAYMLIGDAYTMTSKDCLKELFDRHIIFCLAVDMYQKALEVDSSVFDQATKRIEVFSHYFPLQEEYWGGPIEGDKYKIGCWINRETTVRFSKY